MGLLHRRWWGRLRCSLSCGLSGFSDTRLFRRVVFVYLCCATPFVLPIVVYLVIWSGLGSSSSVCVFFRGSFFAFYFGAVGVSFALFRSLGWVLGMYSCFCSFSVVSYFALQLANLFGFLCLSFSFLPSISTLCSLGMA